MIKWLHFRLPNFGRDPKYFILTSLPLSNRYNSSKKAVTKSTSPSCIWSSENCIPLKSPFRNCMWFPTHASLQRAILNKFAKCLQELVPTPQNMLKSDLGPSSTLYLTKTPPYIFSHIHSEGFATSLEHQPPPKLSYLVFTTDLYKASLSIAYRHNHFPRRALLNWIRLLTPNH